MCNKKAAVQVYNFGNLRATDNRAAILVYKLSPQTSRDLILQVADILLVLPPTNHSSHQSPRLYEA